jgi:putative Mg2+ transporter-C (MgtC) family protein
MDALRDEFLRLPGLDVWVILARLVGATLLSALIGFERELRSHAAGLRTNMLVGLAAATFAVLATALAVEYHGDNIRMDPLRLVSAVTSGVAFLAAGLIVFARGEVHGLTTGASVWLSASIGLAVGIGQWLVAIAAAVGGLLILIAVRRVEKRLPIHGKRRHDRERHRDDDH